MKRNENRFLWDGKTKQNKKKSSLHLFQSRNDYLLGRGLEDDIILFHFKTVVGGKTLDIFLEITSQSG